MKMSKQYIFLAILLLSFLGCDTGTSPASDLPLETINEWGADGFFQYYTNESIRYNSRFEYIGGNANPNPNIYAIDVKKISGAQNKAYGMAFAAIDPRNNYFVNITVNGHYFVGKRENNDVTVIQDWTVSPRLRTGFNTLNTLWVSQSDSTFNIFLNDFDVFQFTDSSITGDRISFITYIGTIEEESFPNTPVDVRFKQTSQ